MLVGMEDVSDDQLSVEAAGKIVGISPRTLRTWIVHGKLPAVGGRRGKLVRLSDVMAAAHANDGEYVSSQPGERWSVDAGQVNDLAPAAPHPIIDSLLAELRDGVIWPLAERLEVLAHENGRLAAERDAAIQERDESASRFDKDNRFVDRLVELLQADLNRANQRIAGLEAEVRGLEARCMLAESNLNPATKALLLLRKRR